MTRKQATPPTYPLYQIIQWLELMEGVKSAVKAASHKAEQIGIRSQRDELAAVLSHLHEITGSTMGWDVVEVDRG